MSKLDTLKTLSCIQHDLKLIESVDLETFKINGQHYYDIAVNLKDIYEDKKHEKIENDDLDKFFNKEQIELLLNVKPLTSQDDFSFYWKKTQEFAKTQTTEIASIEEVADYKEFPVYGETLAAKRSQLQDFLKLVIKVPGYPLEILPNKLNVVVAASHVGKTWYSTALALEMARKGKKVLLVSTEEDEMAFLERTMNVEEDDTAWQNTSFVTFFSLNNEEVIRFVKTAEKEEFDYIIFDYLKKSVWDTYRTDNKTMEEMYAAFFAALDTVKRNMGIFAFIQANRELNDKIENEEQFLDISHKAANMVDGGVPTYNSADNVIFMIKNHETEERILIPTKARREQEKLYSKYKVKIESDFRLSIQKLGPKKEDMFKPNKTYGVRNG